MLRLKNSRIGFFTVICFFVCVVFAVSNLYSKEAVKKSGNSDTGKILNIPVRYYTIARVGGPGMKPSGAEGLHSKIFEKPLGNVGLVLVHCWNVGEVDGPYPIGPNSHCPGEPADWVPTAHEIVKDKIKPVLEAARAAGVEIFHLGQSHYVEKYPQYLEIKKDPELQSVNVPFERCINPKSVKEILA